MVPLKEQGKSGAELGLVLRTVKVLGLDLEVAPPSIGDAADAEDVDIDAIVAAARTLK